MSEHRKIPVVQTFPDFFHPTVFACEQCSVYAQRIIAWPCPEVDVSPVCDSELDAELRELIAAEGRR